MYTFGEKSLKELNGVHPSLVKIMGLAIKRTPMDFAIHDGLRTSIEQAGLVASGASKTQDSKHLIQVETGFGHAVDAVPYFQGKLRWEWKLIYPIADCVRTCAREYGVRICWGGVWDRCLNDLVGDLEKHVKDYTVRHPGPDFIDGPHYELMGL